MTYYKHKSKSGESHKVRELDKIYGYVKRPLDKLRFLTDCFQECIDHHSFGQYDPTVIIEEDELVIREEYLDFLRQKLLDYRRDIEKMNPE